MSKIVLDWSAGGVGPKSPCALCGKPTIIRSPKGTACHKVCAEEWTEARQRQANSGSSSSGRLV
ncbi:hypothetical protein [Polymorphospora sp. NPDC050346]|uniref:hypothetical protein n=1 Tax=Polymorphospora sp. NPDC050346 TaxID=3155780 RepID=UPI0033FB0F50